MLRFISGGLALALSFQCAGDLRIKSPSEACTLLTDTHLRAAAWSRNDDGHEGCRSVIRPVTTDISTGSVISFYAEGVNNLPDKLTLLVEIVSAVDEDHAKRELVKATKRLAVRALGQSIPYPAEESIMKGVPARLAVGTGTLTISRTPANKGHYQMRVVLE